MLQQVLYLTSHCHVVYVLNVKTVFKASIQAVRNKHTQKARKEHMGIVDLFLLLY